jgi:hypothetical protein
MLGCKVSLPPQLAGLGPRGRSETVYYGRMSHLDNAKRALERQGRSGKHTGPTPEDMLAAIKEIIAHLEELDRTPAVTVNAPTK